MPWIAVHGPTRAVGPRSDSHEARASCRTETLPFDSIKSSICRTLMETERQSKRFDFDPPTFPQRAERPRYRQARLDRDQSTPFIAFFAFNLYPVLKNE